MKKSAKKSKKSAKVKKPLKAKRAGKAEISPFYARSKRLSFRLLEASDRDLYCGLYTDAKTMQKILPPLTQEQAERSFDRALRATQSKPFSLHISVIVERGTKQPIGITSLKMIELEQRHAEGGILLKPSAHAQRFAIESSLALVDEAFKWHSIEELHAWVPEGHKVSERLVLGSGFTRNIELPANDVLPARTTWVITRETWAKNFK